MSSAEDSKQQIDEAVERAVAGDAELAAVRQYLQDADERLREIQVMRGEA